MAGPKPKRRLGRGLDALLGGLSKGGEDDNAPSSSACSAHDAVPPENGALSEASGHNEDKDSQLVSVKLIKRNPFQPRTEFDEQSLNELAESIRIHGVLQPILIRKAADGFQLIAGERRLLASQRVGLREVPCRVLELADQEASEAALEENLKRKDLNILERAQAYKDYIDRWGCTIGDLAQRLSMDRSSISNSLRLLDLPEKARKLLNEDKITAGHAKAILPLEENHQQLMCDRILAESLSVRATEKAVREIMRGDVPDVIPMKPKKASTKPEPTEHIQSLERQLRDLLGLKVHVKLKKAESGQVVIDFDSNDDFEKITRFLRKAA